MLNNAFIILFILVIATMIGLSVAVIVTNNKHRKRIEEISMYQINVSATIDESIPRILDTIINESFTDYQVKELVPREEGHINSTREAEIRKELVNLVTARISSAALDKLSLFYNIENIAEILGDKIYITVMNYVIEHNAKIQEPEK